MECLSCHRTGWAEEELAAHNAKPCESISGREMEEHLRFDGEGPLVAGSRERLPCVQGFARWVDRAGDQEKRIKDLERMIAVLKAQVDAIPSGEIVVPGVG